MTPTATTTELETREQRDERISVASQARQLIADQKTPSTAWVNGDTIAYFCKWVVYLSERVDLLTDVLAKTLPEDPR